jgi:hypothetical protein
LQLKLILEYDGTHYNGWQIQHNAPTVQGAVEAALLRLFSQPVRVRVAGAPTPAHALGQVILPSQSSDLLRFQRSLNAILPADIVVARVRSSRLLNLAVTLRAASTNTFGRSGVRRFGRVLPGMFPTRSISRTGPRRMLIGEHDFISRPRLRRA